MNPSSVFLPPPFPVQWLNRQVAKRVSVDRLCANPLLRKAAAKTLKTLPRIAPYLPPPPLIVQKLTLENRLNQVLRQEIEEGEFDFLAQHCLQISITDYHLDFFITLEHADNAQDTRLMLVSPRKADVQFKGNSIDLLAIAAGQEDPDTLFFQRRLVIEGDTELGLQIKNRLDAIDPEQWPRWLKRFFSLFTPLEMTLITNNT